mmetsp:Transcript_4282/g.8754  ORF Transcript_4282/g.8754 Transcript_4282/m.8754 type:complete len:594 (-) Transcript_4282:163-1944(-)
MSARRFLLDAWGRAGGGYFGTSVAAATAGVMTATTLGLGFILDPEATTTTTTWYDRRLLHPATASCEAKKLPHANLKKRMTAIGHFSMLSETPWNPSLVAVAITLKGQAPYTIQDFVHQWQARGMAERHPRFTWTVQNGSFDTSGAVKFPLPVTEGLPPPSSSKEARKDILGRIAYMQFSMLDLTKSLWRAQVIPVIQSAVDFAERATGTTPGAKSAEIVPITTTANKGNNNRSMLLLTSHHALADGVSLAAALADMADEADDMKEAIHKALAQRKAKRKSQSWWQRLIKFFRLGVWFVLGSIVVWFHQVQLLLFAWFWDENPWKTLHQLASPEEPSRTVSLTRAGSLEQAKWTAEVLSRETKSKITINDVFVAAITGALVRQLQYHRHVLGAKQPIEQDENDVDSTKAHQQLLAKQEHMNVVVPVHLKGGFVLPNESVGNNIGAFCARVPGESDDLTPTQRLAQVHQSLQTIKNTPAPYLSHWVANASTKILPASWASYVYQHANAGATAVITNVRGYPKAMHYQGREVESVYGFIPIPPGIPIGVVVQSYNGRMTLSLTAESWAVPDGDRFMVWVLEEYMDLVEAARACQR